jgi:hypothetical protein
MNTTFSADGAIATDPPQQPSDTSPTFVHDRQYRQRLAARALRAAAASWFVVAALGQLLFAVYVMVFYGGAVAQGRPELWNKVLQAGYVAGDRLGNSVLASHLLVAVVVTIGGVLQIVPAIRRHWPRFHRWNGRIYVLAAVTGSAAGLIMIWTRNTGGDLSQHIAISLSALLIMSFAGLAWRHALARRFDVHRRWALRLFLVVNNGWFFRIGLMLWIVLNHGPVGFDSKTFTGPFLTFLSFADYLVPLTVLQLYFHAQESRAPGTQLAMAGSLAILTLATAGGIAAAAMIMWLPHL